jgi:hypothetical protein
MTPELLLELSRLPLFPRTAADLCRVAGMEGAARIISAWGGQEWPVPIRAGGVRPQGIRRYAHLCEIVGEPVAQRIVQGWGGSRLQVPNLKEVLWSRSQDLIRAEFDTLTTINGYSSPEAVFELGIKYGVTGKAIENALKRPDNVKAEPVAQGSLF